MQGLWDDFILLSNRRGYYQSPQPITLEAIEAFDRSHGLSCWEKQVICRLDDAVVGVINKRIVTTTKTRTKAEPDVIPKTDGASLASMFRSHPKYRKAKP